MANPPASPEPPAPVTHGANDPVSHTLALLQPWIDYVPQQQRRLGLFICLALAVHAAICLFLVIDTSVAQMRHESRLYVSVANPQALAVNGQPADLFWDQLTDPRVFLLPMTLPTDLALDMPPPATDSAAASTEMPKPAPPETYRAAQPVASPLEEQVAEAMNPPRQSFAYDETPTPIAANTTWQWDDVLAQRHPAGVPGLPSPVSDTDLSPTKLRVAIDPTGAVEHVLVDQGSGELGASIAKDLDRQAVDAARKIRFDPISAPGLQWGRITIFWRYAAKPQEEVQPTPPVDRPVIFPLPPHETLARSLFYFIRDGFSCGVARSVVVFPTDSPPFAIGRAANFHLWVLPEFFHRAGAVSTAALSEVWGALRKQGREGV